MSQFIDLPLNGFAGDVTINVNHIVKLFNQNGGTTIQLSNGEVYFSIISVGGIKTRINNSRT